MRTAWQPTAHEAEPSRIIGLCIECALRHHVYNQALRCPTGEQDWLDGSRPEAWIDGGRYGLWSSFGIYRLTCGECHREVSNVYVPSQ